MQTTVLYPKKNLYIIIEKWLILFGYNVFGGPPLKHLISETVIEWTVFLFLHENIIPYLT